MATYKHVTEVVQNRCLNHQAKRVDSKAILHLIKTFVGTLIIWINKQTNTNIAYQTNKHKYCLSNKQTIQIKLYTFHPASVYS